MVNGEEEEEEEEEFKLNLTLDIRRRRGSFVAPINYYDTGRAMQILIQQRIHHILYPGTVAGFQVAVTYKINWTFLSYPHRMDLIRIVNVDESRDYSYAFVEDRISHLQHRWTLGVHLKGTTRSGPGFSNGETAIHAIAFSVANVYGRKEVS